MSASRPKLEWIQVLRAVAVLMVVLFHLGTIEAKYGGGPGLLPRAVEAGIAGVDLFFVISGFMMATLMRGAFASPRNALGFLLRRAERIYPAYWFYTALVLAVWLWRPGWVNSSQGGNIEWVRSFLLVPMEGLPALMVGWSLVLEMFYYLVMAGFLAFLPEKRFGWGLGAWAILVGVLSWKLQDRGGACVQAAINPMALEFIVGAAIARQWQGKDRREAPIALGILFVAMLYVAWELGADLPTESHAALWGRVILFGPVSAVILAAALTCEKNRRPAPRWLVAIGDASYSIYLSHVLVLSALGRVWAGIAVPGRWDNALTLPLLAAAAIGAGLASHRWLERPVLEFFRRRRLRGPGGA